MGAARVAALLLLPALATEVTFTPGPGLQKNADGTYSRELTPEYLAHAGALDDDANTTNATRKAARYDAFGNVIPEEEPEAPKSDFQIFAEKILPWLLVECGYRHVAAFFAALWAVGKCLGYGLAVAARVPRPRRRYALPFLLVLLFARRHAIGDFYEDAEAEYRRIKNETMTAIVEEMTGEKPWTFDFPQFKVANGSNATVVERVRAAKELHKQVDVAHKQMDFVNKKIDYQRREHRRLDAQLDAERAALAMVLETHRAIAGEIAGLEDQLGFAAYEHLGEPIVKAIKSRAKSAALLAQTLEDLALVNDTEKAILEAERDRKAKDLNNSKDRVPKDREQWAKDRKKTIKTQLDGHPAYTAAGDLNTTALFTVLLGHCKVQWKRSGWERFFADVWDDPVKHVPRYAEQRRGQIVRDWNWLKRTGVGSYVGLCLFNATRDANASLYESRNVTVEQLYDAVVFPPLNQARQIGGELQAVGVRCLFLVWRLVEPTALRSYAYWRDVAKPRSLRAFRAAFRAASRWLMACEAAPVALRVHSDVVVWVVLLSPVEAWVAWHLLKPPVGLARDYARDAAWVASFPAGLAWWLLWPARAAVLAASTAQALAFAAAAAALADAKRPPRPGARAVALEDGDLL